MPYPANVFLSTIALSLGGIIAIDVCLVFRLF
jgi:hypothetical protein